MRHSLAAFHIVGETDAKGSSSIEQKNEKPTSKTKIKKTKTDPWVYTMRSVIPDDSSDSSSSVSVSEVSRKEDKGKGKGKDDYGWLLSDPPSQEGLLPVKSKRAFDR